MERPYSRGYFTIQFTFARRMATLTGQQLHDVILDATMLYKMLGCRGEFDPEEPVWRGLLEGVDEGKSDDALGEWAHGYYLSRFEQTPQGGSARHWGCFSFEWRPTQLAVRLHFSNQDPPEWSPLSEARMPARIEELRTMFAVIQEEHPATQMVIGRSWLYNLPVYRELFPRAFRASVLVEEPELQFRSLWGQFLRRDGALNQTRTNQFLAAVAALDDASRYAGCFPFQVLAAQAPITDFYELYRL